MSQRKKSLINFLNRHKKILGVSVIAVLLLGFAIGFAINQNDDESLQQPTTIEPEQSPVVEEGISDESSENEEKSEVQVQTEEKPQPQESTQENNQTIAGPLSLLVLVNKRNQINPINYSPPNLVVPDVVKRSGATMDARAANALENMFTAAKNDGVTLMLSNGFRSYGTQQTLYNNYVRQDGQTAADTYSARPGHSEHQTGLAADIISPSGTCSLEQCFGNMAEGKWLEENSYKYGFIIRYTETNKSEAGYTYEPWHLRYIGVSEAASYFRKNASSLESYLGKPAAPDYL